MQNSAIEDIKKQEAYINVNTDTETTFTIDNTQMEQPHNPDKKKLNSKLLEEY